MFAQKITDIEKQIQQLTEQVNQYRTLSADLEQAVRAIANITETATKLDATEVVRDALSKAMGIAASTPQPDTPSTPSTPPSPQEAPQITEEQARALHFPPDEPKSQWEQSLDEAENEFLDEPEEQDDDALVGVEVDDLVEIPSGQTGRVTYVGMKGGLAIANILLPDGTTSNLHASNLTFRGRYQPEEKQDETAPKQLEMPTGIEVGDLVQTPTGKVGHVSYKATMNGTELATVVLVGGTSNFHVSNLRYVGKYQPEPQPQPEKPDYALAQKLAPQILKCKTWAEVRDILLEHPVPTRQQALREAALAARTKSEKAFIEHLPASIATYANHAQGGMKDLDWIPAMLRAKAQEILDRLDAA